MIRKLSTGIERFSKLRKNNIFYIDKTHFIKEWWEQGDEVTLITRPRRFGKTLMLDTVRTFFSIEYHDSSSFFNGLFISKDKELYYIQGKIPVIFISFSGIKSANLSEMKYEIKTILSEIYSDFEYILDLNMLSDREREQYSLVNKNMSDTTAKKSLYFLTKYLARQFGIDPIILLDEYDTPMQEAWLKGYLDGAVEFLRGLFNSTFKTNPWLGRGLMTGITCVSNESLFSDLNNLKVVTTTSKLYADCFGFTEEEVFAAMDEYGLTEKDEVRQWYDGFRFGEINGIYNPWSIIGYLSEHQFAPYWAQTSSNAMVGQLIGPAEVAVKMQIEDLLQGKSISIVLDEQIVFSRLYDKKDAIWSFLMASGYVKPLSFNSKNGNCELALVNFEVKRIIENLITDWFNNRNVRGTEFRNALLTGDLDSMNAYMSEIAENTFSFFDTGGKEPERFYHAFVLGLIVDLKGRYEIVSSRESGFGRCDVMLFPLRKGDRGIVIEFKTRFPRKEKNLEDTCASALGQIAEKRYADALAARGVARGAIYAYGFGLKGKQVLIRGGAVQETGQIAGMEQAPPAGDAGTPGAKRRDKAGRGRRKAEGRC